MENKNICPVCGKPMISILRVSRNKSEYIHECYSCPKERLMDLKEAPAGWLK